MSLDRAIEAAAEAISEWNIATYGHRTDADHVARIAVEAAAPYLAHQTWSDVKRTRALEQRAEQAEAEVRHLTHDNAHIAALERRLNRAYDEVAQAKAEIGRLRTLVEACHCWHTAGDPF